MTKVALVDVEKLIKTILDVNLGKDVKKEAPHLYGCGSTPFMS